MIARIFLTLAVFLLLLPVSCTHWEDIGKRGGYALPPKEVPVDMSALPETPTEQDFALLATDLLDRETGFTDFRPFDVVWMVACGSDLHIPDKVLILASWFSSTDAHPHVLAGDVWIWPRRDVAKIAIGDAGVRSSTEPAGSYDSYSLSDTKLHAGTVLHLAEEQGGREFRQTIQNQCEIVLRLSSGRPTWLVEYQPLRGEDCFCMTVERHTGIYTTTMSSTGCSGCEWEE
jgi:hypothetical protein